VYFSVSAESCPVHPIEYGKMSSGTLGSPFLSFHLDDFEPRQMVGRGGTSRVFLAHYCGAHAQLRGKNVVIKVMDRFDAMPTMDFLEVVEPEFHILDILSRKLAVSPSPHIVRYWGHFEAKSEDVLLKLDGKSDDVMQEYMKERKTRCCVFDAHVVPDERVLATALDWRSVHGGQHLFVANTLVRVKERLKRRDRRAFVVKCAQLGDQLFDAMRTLQRMGILHMDLKMDNVVIDDQGKAVIIDFGCARMVDADAVVCR
jgi:serine/threonine protein kinase